MLASCISAYGLDSVLIKLVSSANINVSLLTLSGRSLIKNKNRIGPSVEPCGTPALVDLNSEVKPLTITRCCLVAK